MCQGHDLDLDFWETFGLTLPIHKEAGKNEVRPESENKILQRPEIPKTIILLTTICNVIAGYLLFN